jgi:hypothetical protein
MNLLVQSQYLNMCIPTQYTLTDTPCTHQTYKLHAIKSTEASKAPHMTGMSHSHCSFTCEAAILDQLR